MHQRTETEKVKNERAKQRNTQLEGCIGERVRRDNFVLFVFLLCRIVVCAANAVLHVLVAALATRTTRKQVENKKQRTQKKYKAKNKKQRNKKQRRKPPEQQKTGASEQENKKAKTREA